MLLEATRPDWSGKTVVCIASGPSLTPEDCAVVQTYAHPVIVTNTSFRLCPWADVLFAFDSRWWTMYHPEVKASFKGRLISHSRAVCDLGVETTWNAAWFNNHGNSGACAIALAVAGGASKVVLIGFDCQATGGQVHWHGDHPKGLTNAASMKRWPSQFKAVAQDAHKQGVKVINASRQTALNCFKRQALEAAL